MDTAGQIARLGRGQERGHRPHIRDRGQLVGRRAFGGRGDKFVEMVDAAGRTGHQRPRRQGMHADALFPQLGRGIADATFQCGLDRAHHVVMSDHAAGAEKAD